MKRFGKIVLWCVAMLVVVLVVAISFTIGWRPFFGPSVRPATQTRFESTPQRLARGQYIFESVSACVDCHSEHDWTKPDAPIPPGRKAAGAVFPESDLPGRVVAPNLTADPETGLGNWSDDEIARAIREAII